MFMSREHLQELSGLQRPQAVARWLTRERIPYIMGADKWPRVLEAVVRKKLGENVQSVQPSTPEPQLRSIYAPPADGRRKRVKKFESPSGAG